MMFDNLIFDLDTRKYLLGSILGSGSYGVVVSGDDRINNRQVALKQIPRLFDHLQMTKKVIREIRLLNSLRHSNIISLYDLELAENSVYIITEKCDTDMKKLIQQEKLNSTLKPMDQLFIMHQVLNAIEFIHSIGVIHRDIKPANILLDKSFNVKLCDFGLARVMNGGCNNSNANLADPDATQMTEYVVTRWYRAPEVVIAPGMYGKAQDIWSAGCTFSELFIRTALFPGTSVLNQLQTIVNVLGKPSARDLDFGISGRARRFMDALSSERIGLSVALSPVYTSNGLLYDLFSSMLLFNPKYRITATAAFQHAVFADVRSLIPQYTASPQRLFPNANNAGGSSTNASPSFLLESSAAGINKSLVHDIQKIDVCANSTGALRKLMETEINEMRIQLNKRFTFSPTSKYSNGSSSHNGYPSSVASSMTTTCSVDSMIDSSSQGLRKLSVNGEKDKEKDGHYNLRLPSLDSRRQSVRSSTTTTSTSSSMAFERNPKESTTENHTSTTEFCRSTSNVTADSVATSSTSTSSRIPMVETRLPSVGTDINAFAASSSSLGNATILSNGIAKTELIIKRCAITSNTYTANAPNSDSKPPKEKNLKEADPTAPPKRVGGLFAGSLYNSAKKKQSTDAAAAAIAIAPSRRGDGVVTAAAPIVRSSASAPSSASSKDRDHHHRIGGGGGVGGGESLDVLTPIVSLGLTTTAISTSRSGGASSSGSNTQLFLEPIQSSSAHSLISKTGSSVLSTPASASSSFSSSSHHHHHHHPVTAPPPPPAPTTTSTATSRLSQLRASNSNNPYKSKKSTSTSIQHQHSTSAGF